MTKIPAFKKASAYDELVNADMKRSLFIQLLTLNLSVYDAQALASNVVELYSAIDWVTKPGSPAEILDMYSLEEISDIYKSLLEYQNDRFDYEDSGMA